MLPPAVIIRPVTSPVTSTKAGYPVHAQALLVYLVASGLVGLAVTYYFDNPGNVKLMTILQVGLQLGGLALVALSTNCPEVSLSCCCLLVAWKIAPDVGAYWRRLAAQR